MVTSRRSANLNVMMQAAEKAGRALLRDFGEVENLQVSKKGPGDFVSAADKKSEQILIAELQRVRPKFGLLLEESGVIEGSDPDSRWIVDPLDGTTNFLHGIPHWAVSIALEYKKEIIAAVTYDPVKNEMFIAEKGSGAYLNHRRLRVSPRDKLSESVLCLGEVRSSSCANALTALPGVAGFRRFGSASLDLAYVAAARVEGYWERGLQPWDVAAGSLLVREAGGFVTDLQGGKDFLNGSSICAANPVLHAEILKHLKSTPAPSQAAG